MAPSRFADVGDGVAGCLVKRIRGRPRETVYRKAALRSRWRRLLTEVHAHVERNRATPLVPDRVRPKPTRSRARVRFAGDIPTWRSAYVREVSYLLAIGRSDDPPWSILQSPALTSYLP